MIGKGNGRPEQCAANLLMTVRGEVPYERLKGLDAALIDKPSSTVSPAARADAEWALGTYEPRVAIDNITIENLFATEGKFGFNVDVTKRGGTP